MKALNVFLSLLVSALMGLGFIEVGLRVLGFGPPVTLNTPDAATGWAKKRDTTITRRTSEGFEVTYALNAQGLRDDDAVNKPEGAFRIVALGDSFTLGYTVARDDLFVDLLERRLQAEGRPIQVINAGTEAWSTDQEVVWLQQNGATWKPDLVLLFAYENDIYWNGQRSYYGSPKPLFDATGALETGALSTAPTRSLFRRTAIGNLVSGGPAPDLFEPQPGVRILKEWAPLLTTPPDFLGDALARTEGTLRALQTSCLTLGCQVVVAPIPSHSAIDPAYGRDVFSRMALGGLPADAWSADRPVDSFLAMAQAVGVPALDARPALRDAFATGGADLYFGVDWHLNPAGNRAFAAFLHDGLDSLGLLPPATQAVAAAATPAPARTVPRWVWSYLGLWVVLGASFATFYRTEEKPLPSFLKVGALLAVIFATVIGGGHLVGLLPPLAGRMLLVVVIVGLFTFIAYKLGDRLETIIELVWAFALRGHWYLMPLLVILLTIGSLLVVAASSPLVAPFIYTLF